MKVPCFSQNHLQPVNLTPIQICNLFFLIAQRQFWDKSKR
ncbi:hypothetical protein LINPERHAP1_LOCUS27206, partial [Linum perenne]